MMSVMVKGKIQIRCKTCTGYGKISKGCEHCGGHGYSMIDCPDCIEN